MPASTTVGFRQRLRTKAHLVGTFIKTPSAILCEVMGLSALDVVCLDAEHAPFDRLVLDSCIAALRSEKMPCLVRTASCAPEHILSALDMGADGVLVPHIRNAEEARAVVRSARYARGGQPQLPRGYAGSSRAAGYGSKSVVQHLADSDARTSVLLQIEDVEALPEVSSIAASHGVDAIFIGRADLAVSMGETTLIAPAVVAACHAAIADAAASGVAVGVFVAQAEEIPAWRALGVTLFLVGSDHALLLSGAKRLASVGHGAAPGSAEPPIDLAAS